MPKFIVEETNEVIVRYAVEAKDPQDAIQQAQGVAWEDGEQVSFLATGFMVWTPEELERNGTPIYQEAVETNL